MCVAPCHNLKSTFQVVQHHFIRKAYDKTLGRWTLMLTGIPCRGPLSFSGTASSSAAFASASLSFKYHNKVEKLCMLKIREMYLWHIFKDSWIYLGINACFLLLDSWNPYYVKPIATGVRARMWYLKHSNPKLSNLTLIKEHLEKNCDCISFLLGGDCSSLVSRQHSWGCQWTWHFKYNK